jgi:sialate O-acetylesterase
VRAESADEGRTVILQCEFAAGLYSKGDISGFEVAGDDGLFHAADAVIEGNTLRISSAVVAVPEAVRYAWRNNPLANVYNADGLPLRPFWLGVED